MYDATIKLIHDASSQGHGSAFTIIIIGIVFGLIIQFSQMHKFEKIAGFSILKDTVVPKILFLTIGLSSIGFFIMVQLGYASFHVKPIILGGLIIGGILFGIAMAIFGKCPGTGPVSIAEGQIDVLVGAVGGILGGFVFTYFYPFFKPLMGESMGSISLTTLVPGFEPYIVLAFGIGLIIISIKIPLLEYEDEREK